MFRLVCKKIVQNRAWLDRDSKKPAFCLLKIPFLFRFVSTVDSDSKHASDSFTLSYLINSCGLPVDKATSISKKYRIRSSPQPDSVLAFLKSYDFDDTHIAKIIQMDPGILGAKVDTTLKPKFEFFKSIGVSGPDFATILSKEPRVLSSSLANQIIPSINFLKTIIHTDAEIFSMLKRSTWLLLVDPQKSLIPKIAVLRSHGVPNSNILFLFVNRPRVWTINLDRFKDIVEDVVEMKFDPAKGLFVRAVNSLACMSKSTRMAKFGVFRKWGWSEDDIRNGFRVEPNCFNFSEKTISLKMDFLVNKVGFDQLLLAKYIAVLRYSMEKKIVPRCSVIKMLISSGCVEKDCNLNAVMKVSDKAFLKRYIVRFEKIVPELFAAYQGKINVFDSHHGT